MVRTWVAVTAEVVATRRPNAAAHDVCIETVLGPATVLGDVRLAERLVANLVENAVRHNVPGGRVWVETTTGAYGVTLRVANTGPMVPSEELHRLLQPFQRLSAERTAARDGIGLGLAIVAAVATAHDARLDTRALPAGGLAVEIRFNQGAVLHTGPSACGSPWS